MVSLNVLVSNRTDRQKDRRTDRKTDAISMFWAFLVLKTKFDISYVVEQYLLPSSSVSKIKIQYDSISERV